MKYFSLLFLSLISITPIFSQVRSMIELQKVQGYGPQGTTFYSIAENEKSEFRDIYPKVAHVPENWRDIKEYYYVLNEQQLLFQSYVAGKLDKKTLSDQFAKRKYLLQDTLGLSRSGIITGISYVVGKEKDSDTYHYIIDRNNNNDFGDDVIKQLAPQNSLFGGDILGEKIRYQYYHESKIQDDEILMSLSISSDNYVYITFPQYYLANVPLNGKSYFICKNIGSPGVYVLPALPYFNPVKADKRLLNGQYFTIDNVQFTIKNILLDGKYIEVEGPNNLKEGIITPSMTPTTEKRSAQAGFKAPSFSGTNILDGTKWSLDSLKNDKYIFLYFWSTTCVPCIQDLKNLSSIAKKYKDKVQFIGICDVRSDLQKILSAHQVTWPTLVLQNSSIKSTDYDLYKYPTSFLLNRDHIVEKMDLRSDVLRNFLENKLL